MRMLGNAFQQGDDTGSLDAVWYDDTVPAETFQWTGPAVGRLVDSQHESTRCFNVNALIKYVITIFVHSKPIHEMY